MIYLAHAQDTHTYQILLARYDTDPSDYWDEPAHVRVQVHVVDANAAAHRHLCHELREWYVRERWYKLPADVAELVPLMMDELAVLYAKRRRPLRT